MKDDETFADYATVILEAFFIFMLAGLVVSIPVLGLAWLAGDDYSGGAQFLIYALATSVTIAVTVKRHAGKK